VGSKCHTDDKKNLELDQTLVGISDPRWNCSTTPPWVQLSFARIGWTWIDAMERCNSYEDIFYNDDDSLFYAIRGNGDIHTIDLN
jgi:hypothetical protein